MNVLRLWRQPYTVADLQAELARGADGYPADPVDRHIEEGVGAEVLGHLDRARPAPALARQVEVLRSDADRRAAELRRHVAANEVHLRRADEAGDEEIVGT